MAITSAICTSFKQQLLVGTHNFTNGANSFKLALYTSSATLGAGTTVYVTTGQASGTNYVAGGSALTNVTPFATGTTAVCDFNDLTFSTATITARGGFPGTDCDWRYYPTGVMANALTADRFSARHQQGGD